MSQSNLCAPPPSGCSPSRRCSPSPSEQGAAAAAQQRLLTVAMVTGSVALLALGSAARRLCGCAGAAGQSHVTSEGGARSERSTASQSL